MEGQMHPTHTTYHESVYDPPGGPLLSYVLPDRPLTYLCGLCHDCDWIATAKTYAEILDARDIHEYQASAPETLEGQAVRPSMRVMMAPDPRPAVRA